MESCLKDAYGSQSIPRLSPRNSLLGKQCPGKTVDLPLMPRYRFPVPKGWSVEAPKEERSTAPIVCGFFAPAPCVYGREGGSYTIPVRGNLPARLFPSFEPPGRHVGVCRSAPAGVQALEEERFSCRHLPFALVLA